MFVLLSIGNSISQSRNAFPNAFRFIYFLSFLAITPALQVLSTSHFLLNWSLSTISLLPAKWCWRRALQYQVSPIYSWALVSRQQHLASASFHLASTSFQLPLFLEQVHVVRWIWKWHIVMEVRQPPVQPTLWLMEVWMIDKGLSWVALLSTWHKLEPSGESSLTSLLKITCRQICKAFFFFFD